MNGAKVPQEKIDNILEATRLSASSMGLQPYTVILVENEELRNKIKPIAMNQPQIAEASHLLIFAAWDDITEQQIDAYIDNIVTTRGVSAESMAEYRNIMAGHIGNMTQEQRHQWAARQAYIAFGTAIAAAASESVDATPMEGFNGPALDELLGLKEKGLRSVTLLPLGYRDEQNDFLFGAKKVRRSKEELILELA
jgi:nitroreductase